MNTPAPGTDLLDLAVGAARAHSKALDAHTVEEVAAETIYQYLKTVSNVGLNGQVVNQSTHAPMHPYVTAIARNLVAQIGGQTQSADRWALKEFWRRRNAAEQAEGCHLTTVDEDVLADQIRSEQAPSHRAATGFHRRNPVPSSLSRAAVVHQADQFSQSDATGAGPNRVGGGEFAPYSVGDDLLVALNAGTIDKVSARSHIWDALAERRYAPLVARGSLSASAAKHVTQFVRARGATVVAGRWLEQSGTEAEERNLFRPFGNIGQVERERAAALLLDVPERFAHRLFYAATFAAVA